MWKDGKGHGFQRDLRNQLLLSFLCVTSERIQTLKYEVTCLIVPSGWWQNWITWGLHSWSLSIYEGLAGGGGRP